MKNVSVSQKKIAELLGISAMTVSRVINNSRNVSPETRQKVLKAIKELKYYPNMLGRALNKGKTNTIGIIIPFTTHIFSTQYFIELLAGIENFCAKNSYDLIFQTKGDEEKEIDYKKPYKERKVDGLIIIAPPVKSEQIKELIDEKIPFVVIDGRLSSNNISFVDADNIKGAEIAVSHLIELGHKRIGFIAGWDYVSNGKDRFTGYKKALKKYNIEFNEKLVFKGDFSENKGYEAVKYFFNLNNPPTAIFAANDLMALGAIRALNSLNLKVPEEVSIVGFDDIPISQYFNPPLTTIRQPIRKMGEKAAEILIKKIKKELNTEEKFIFPIELIIRKTTAKPKKD